MEKRKAPSKFLAKVAAVKRPKARTSEAWSAAGMAAQAGPTATRVMVGKSNAWSAAGCSRRNRASTPARRPRLHQGGVQLGDGGGRRIGRRDRPLGEHRHGRDHRGDGEGGGERA